MSSPISMFPDSSGVPADPFSSKEAYDKVNDGLAGKIGEPVAVISSEMTMMRSHREDIYDLKLKVGNLLGEPFVNGDSSPFYGINLPMALDRHSIGDPLYLLGPSHVREGPISFNAIDPEIIRIQKEGARLEGRGLIDIYVGDEAVEAYFGEGTSPIMGYVKALYALGGHSFVPTRLLDTYDQEIEEARQEARDSLERVIGNYMLKGVSEKNAGKIEIKIACKKANLWSVVGDDDTYRNGFTSIDVRSFVDHFLKED